MTAKAKSVWQVFQSINLAVSLLTDVVTSGHESAENLARGWLMT